jgi:hypothetical protein
VTATATTRTGKTHAVLHVAAQLRMADVADDDQDDVALADVLVLGTRLADLQLNSLEKGSPAWNACHAYQAGHAQPWAAGHYETLTRHWAHYANALNEATTERGRDQ